MRFQEECYPFIFLWFSGLHKVIYPSNDVTLTLWLLCVFESFLWRTLIVFDGISNLLFLHVESSFKVCQSWYPFIKALSLLQGLFVCVVSNNVFQNSSSDFLWSHLQGLLFCTYPGLIKGWCPLVILVFWCDGTCSWKVALLVFVSFPDCSLNIFGHDLLSFICWPVRIIIL